MSTKLAKLAADFSTSLATKLAAGASSCSLQSATDDDGVALPDGNYYFTLDGDNAQKEHIFAALSGTSLTGIKSVSRQGVQTSNAVREHRIGASVTMTNFAHILYVSQLLDGTTDLDASNPLAYDADPDLTGNNKKLATVKLVEDTAMAGGADASTTVKGISKLSVAPASATEPIAVGVNDPKLPPVDTSSLNADKLAALAGTSGTPSSTNKYVTNDDTATAATADKVARRNATGDITVPTTPTADTDATSKSYVDNNSGAVLCTAGVNITSGQAVSAYADGKIYPTDASVANGTNFVGFALADIATNATGYIKYAGFATKSGLTPAATYYLSDATTSSVGYGVSDAATSTDEWQSFITGVSQTNISKVVLGLLGTGSATDTMRIYSGEGTGGTLLATVNWTGNPGASSVGSPAAISFQLANPIPVSPSSTYTIRWTNASGHNWVYKTAGAYADGRAGSNAAWDMYFSVQYYNVAGAIGTSAGTVSKKVGMAVTSTQLLIKQDN